MRTPHGHKEIARYEWLLSQGLTPLEAREFASSLTRETPALRAFIADRVEFKRKFDADLLRRMEAGTLTITSNADVEARWRTAISKLYTRRGWRVQQGAVGDQPSFPRGSMNPWAGYRFYEKSNPDPRNVSPWQLRKHFGKTRLERGLLFIQKAEKRGGATYTQISLWIAQKTNAIAKARGTRKAQLQIELGRLERLQEKMA